MVNYFSSKSKCSYMFKSWIVAFCTAVFFNSPCFQYILRNKRSNIWERSIGLNFSLTRNDEKSDFWPWKWGVDVYTDKYVKSPERTTCKKEKRKLCSNGTCHEKKCFSHKAIWYKSLDLAEKEKLLSHRAELYKSLDPKVKEELLFKSAEWYKSLGSAEKQNILSSRAIWYKSLDTAQKQKRAEWFNSLNSAQKQKRAEWYKSLNPEEKEKLLSGRAEWYKTLDPADKDKIISQVTSPS